MVEKIDKFSGPYRFLSNFWMVPINLAGKVWPSVEHFYQAMKHSDEETREKIREMETPALAKYAGRNVLYHHPKFPANRLKLMEIAVTQKFEQHPDLAKMLLYTYPAELIEGNTWGDRYWGVCDGGGDNHLGRILMKVRKKLKEKVDFTEE